MPENAGPSSNSDLLLTHLDDESLAYRLVRAYLERDVDDPAETLKIVLQERLNHVRSRIDDPKD